MMCLNAPRELVAIHRQLMLAAGEQRESCQASGSTRGGCGDATASLSTRSGGSNGSTLIVTSIALRTFP